MFDSVAEAKARGVRLVDPFNAAAPVPHAAELREYNARIDLLQLDDRQILLRWTVAPQRIHVFGHRRTLRLCTGPNRKVLRIDLRLDNFGKVRPPLKETPAHRVAMVGKFKRRQFFYSRDLYTALEKYPGWYGHASRVKVSFNPANIPPSAIWVGSQPDW